jgi:hypothetical protein
VLKEREGREGEEVRDGISRHPHSVAGQLGNAVEDVGHILFIHLDGGQAEAQVLVKETRKT